MVFKSQKAVLCTSYITAADLCDVIGNVIPLLIQRLDDLDWSVRQAVGMAMAELAKNGT
jgi:hypothetical protein